MDCDLVTHFFQLILQNCHSSEQICFDIKKHISESGSGGLFYYTQRLSDDSNFESIQCCIEEAAYNLESLPEPQKQIQFVSEFHDDHMMIIGTISFESNPTSIYIIFLTPSPDVNIYIMPIAEMSWQYQSTLAKTNLLTISNKECPNDSLLIWIHNIPNIFDKNGSVIDLDHWDR